MAVLSERQRREVEIFASMEFGGADDPAQIVAERTEDEECDMFEQIKRRLGA